MEGDKVSKVEIKDRQIEIGYDEESNCIIRIKELRMPPHSEILISFGVRKILLPFE